MKRVREDSSRKCPQYYKIGDRVEAVKLNIGAWFDADIVDIYPTPKCACFDQCQCLFKIIFESDEEEDKAEVAERTLGEIRQVSYSSLDWESLKPGMKVVINYNIENPTKWGYWYDFVVEAISKRDCVTYVNGTLLVGYNGVTGKIPVEINSDDVSDILEIRPHVTISEKESECYETGVKPEYCKSCKNKPKAKCRKCCCCKCGLKKDFQLTVQCDECADWYHIYCLNPPLTGLPNDDEWYCPKCSNDTFWTKVEDQKSKKEQRKRSKMRKKERYASADIEEKKTKTKIAALKRPPDIKPTESETKMISMKTLISEIPKNSVIWNDVEKFFPRYEVVQISVTLADKGKEDNRVLNPTLERLIYADEMNEHLWNEAKKSIDKGKEAFLAHVRRLFTCSICCELMNDPITLSCKHSFCITCFFKSLSVNVYNCALCRTDVIHTEHYLVNENLAKALKLLFEK